MLVRAREWGVRVLMNPFCTFSKNTVNVNLYKAGGISCLQTYIHRRRLIWLVKPLCFTSQAIIIIILLIILMCYDDDENKWFFGICMRLLRLRLHFLLLRLYILHLQNCFRLFCLPRCCFCCCM